MVCGFARIYRCKNISLQEYYISRFLKCLCGLLSAGEKKSYSEMMSYLRCRLSFALLRMAVMCARGSRSSYHRPVNALREVALAEGRHWRQ